MARCDHCLLGIGEGEAVRGPQGEIFCCEGCRAVYAFIGEEGLESFYRRRTWKEEEARPSEPVRLTDVEPFEDIVRLKDGRQAIDVYIDGIRCASCVWLVEKVLQKTEGVASARVNYATHRATVQWDPGRTDLATVLERIGSTGYVPKPYSESEGLLARRAESRDLLVRFGTAAFLSSQLMIYSTALYAGYFQGMAPGIRRAFEFISLFLATPILFYAALPLVRTTLSGLRRMRFTMDSLIVLGSGSAYFYSIYGLAKGGEVYFDTAAMIVTLILLGRYLESRAKGKASEAVERLAELSPKRALRVLPGREGELGRGESVEVASLRPGDLVQVKPGEKFAADGVVVSGESSADESLITGESKPVPKLPGGRVIGGSINRHGSLVFEVRKSGRDTVLAGIIASVEEAQASKPAIQGLADRVVGLFVPMILLLAGGTVTAYLASGAGMESALMTGISVLVIACPCSLGLATPLAVLVYTTSASSRGLLLKGGDVAEHAARIEGVIFDKTGTVTKGEMVLVEVLPVDPSLGKKEYLDIAASIERYSEHGLGTALLEAAGTPSSPRADGFEALPGRGVTGIAGGRKVFLGNDMLMEEAGIAVPPEDAVRERRERGERDGETIVSMGWEGDVRALFFFTDGMRSEAPAVVASLRDAGVDVSLVSGDNAGATGAVARSAGIDTWRAGVSPEEKRRIVAGLQAAGGAVMMVGDGINDAPALTESRVGVAIGRGTDVAMESADAVMTRSDLRLVPWLLRSSKASYAVIRQNIFWAFFYNVVAIPLAVVGVLHPIVAAAAMASSSLFVVINSLRIRRFGAGEYGE